MDFSLEARLGEPKYFARLGELVSSDSLYTMIGRLHYILIELGQTCSIFWIVVFAEKKSYRPLILKLRLHTLQIIYVCLESICLFYILENGPEEVTPPEVR